MIYLSADHRGFELKEKIKNWLSEWSIEYEDYGAFQYNKDDDYVDFISKVAQKVSEDPENNKGIVLGMTGQGEAVVANKFKGVRATVFYGPTFQLKGFKTWLLILGGMRAGGIAEKIIHEYLSEIIKLSKEHNNANVLSLGAYFLQERTAKFFIKLWLDTKFSGEERHVRRINKIKEIEKNG